MPTFTGYPALQGYTADIPAAMQRGTQNAQMNQLRQMKIQAEPGRIQRQTQMEEMQISTGEQEEKLRKAVDISNRIAPVADPGISPIEISQRWVKIREMAEQAGVDVSKAPPLGAPPEAIRQWATAVRAAVGQYKTKLEQQGVKSPAAEAQEIRIGQGKRAPQLGTNQMQNAAAMGLTPGSPEYQQSVRDQALKPLVSIGGQETARAKAAGKGLGEFEVETYVNIQKAGRSTREQDARLDRLDQLLDQTETGFGAEFLTKLRKADIALGWNVIGDHESVAPAEAAMALSNEMALQLRNPASGAGMPGQLSDKDRDFLVTMVPGLGQTRAGRKLLISARKKLNKRTREVAKRARQYFSEHNNTLGVGFVNELSDWSDENPIFTKEDMTAREAARLPHVNPGDPPLPSGTYFVDPNGEIRIAP